MSVNPPGMVKLGKSSVSVSAMGVGTNRWGTGIGRARQELRPVFEAALEHGFTFFDTAEVYGFGGSERSLGQFIQPSRVKPVVLSKFYPYPWRPTNPGSLLAALRSSLKRLRLEQVNVYIVHFPIPPSKLEPWADGLLKAVDAGLVGAVGVSNYSAEQMQQTYTILKERGIPLACNEVEYSLLKRDAEYNGVWAQCRELEVTLIAYRPLALGMVTPRLKSMGSSPGWRRMFARSYARKAAVLSSLLTEIGDAHGGKSPSQVALNWVMCKGALPIPGTTCVAHLLENAGARGWKMTEEEINTLDACTAQN
jgi:aryl-alcohol dehydrogenase-like predicted oxidoreductase